MFKENGYHSVRRSDRYWAGLWLDLIIEQAMMRSIKSRGGLTRGRSFTKSTRHQFTNVLLFMRLWRQSQSQHWQIVNNLYNWVYHGRIVMFLICQKDKLGSESVIRSMEVQSWGHYLQGYAMMVESIATTVRKWERKFKNNLIISKGLK